MKVRCLHLLLNGSEIKGICKASTVVQKQSKHTKNACSVKSFDLERQAHHEVGMELK